MGYIIKKLHLGWSPEQIGGAQTYFCEPYLSWVKRSAEHTIELIRRSLPKKIDFAIIT